MKLLNELLQFIKDSDDFIPDQLLQGYSVNKEVIYDDCNYDEEVYLSLFFWIKFRKTTVPKELLFEGYENFEGINGQTPLDFWIKYRKTDIPKELYFEGYQKHTKKESLYPCFYWFQYRHGSIPKELLFEGYETAQAANGTSLFSLCVQHKKYQPPKQYYFKGCGKQKLSYCNENALFYWLRNINKEPPQEIYYENFQCDTGKEGLKPLFMWIMFRDGPIPENYFYRGFQTDKDINGLTPLYYWIQYRDTPIPDILLYPNLNNWNKLKLTPAEYWKQERPNQEVPHVLIQ